MINAVLIQVMSGVFIPIKLPVIPKIGDFITYYDSLGKEHCSMISNIVYILGIDNQLEKVNIIINK
jgi:hypothetical protein